MKNNRIGDLKTVMSNPDSIHHYFGWLTVKRLKNGKIVVSASGFRLAHVCPFGKGVTSFRYDGGKSRNKGEYIYSNDFSGDLGYPSTIEFANGSLLTVFYARHDNADEAIILGRKGTLSYE